ncbi:MAG: exodeoxyribonuclease VII small subunit [Gammaproteobacteria bacterium]
MSKKLANDKPAAPDFEKALAELERIVEKMEKGEQSLEEALASFQRGVELTRACQQGLKQAEQRVEKLMRDGAGFKLDPFNDNEDDGSDPRAGT